MRLTLIVLSVCLFAFSCSTAVKKDLVIDNAAVGVLHEKNEGKGVLGKFLLPGTHSISSNDTVIMYSITLQRDSIEKMVIGRDSDTYEVNRIAVEYILNKDNIDSLDLAFGHSYLQGLIAPNIKRSIFKATMGNPALDSSGKIQADSLTKNAFTAASAEIAKFCTLKHLSFDLKALPRQ